MNPLQQHPILKQLGYKTIHDPTLEGIKAGLSKRRKRLVYAIYYQVFFMVLLALNNLMIADSLLSTVLGVLCMVSIPLLFWMFNREGDKYLLSDTEIEEELKKHEVWKNNPES